MTKAAAEQLIKAEASDLPVTVFRPAIGESCSYFIYSHTDTSTRGVTLVLNGILFFFCLCTVIATASEPLPGWIDNLYGPTGIVTGVMTGIIKTLPCEMDVRTDLVPADLTVNALIAAAYDTNVR